MKESTLLKIVVLITFLPNILIPIMNYQFNFAVNEAFKTEGGLVAFFGFFRGALNIISFVLLMFTRQDVHPLGPAGGAYVPPLQLRAGLFGLFA